MSRFLLVLAFGAGASACTATVDELPTVTRTSQAPGTPVVVGEAGADVWVVAHGGDGGELDFSWTARDGGAITGQSLQVDGEGEFGSIATVTRKDVEAEDVIACTIADSTGAETVVRWPVQIE